MLALVGLHEGYANADYLEAMSQQVDTGWIRDKIDELMTALSNAGLCKELGDATYEMHSLLTSYLRLKAAAPTEALERAFVEVMARLANALTRRELHEQRIPFLLHGSNFRSAWALAHKHSLELHFVALKQSTAAHAQKLRQFNEAFRLFSELAEHARAVQHWKHQAAAYHQLE